MRISRRLLISLWLAAFSLHAADLEGYVFVNDDGSLRIHGKTVVLYGIYIPPTDDSCSSFQRPVVCAPRAALALEFNIGSNFVDCDIKDKTTDGNLVGLCYANNRDLAAQLLLQGWAVARPEASIEYHTLEKMARNRGVGIWGIPIDRLR